MSNLCKSEETNFIGMRENFRSRPGIIELANDLISQDRERLDLKVIPTRDPSTNADVIFWSDAPDQPTEAAGIAHSIRSEGQKEEDVAVLLRTNHLTQVYTDALKAQGIRIRSIKRERLPADMEKALALISYAENPKNDATVLRFVTIWKDARAARDIRKAAIDGHKAADDLVLKLGEAQDRPKTLLLLHKRGVSSEALEAIRRVWDEDSPHSAVIQILRTPEIVEAEGEGVTVCTMHAAKGREWDHVYIPAVEEGIVPQTKKDSVVAEERRLFYVAITRARETVTISWAKKRKAAWGNGEQPVEKSHFLNGLVP